MKKGTKNRQVNKPTKDQRTQWDAEKRIYTNKDSDEETTKKLNEEERDSTNKVWSTRAIFA